jgi:hypothetical protein
VEKTALKLIQVTGNGGNNLTIGAAGKPLGFWWQLGQK